MNILITDDLLLPEESKADFPLQRLFLRFAKENQKRRILLAKEFQKLGANVLLARLELCKSDVPVSFEYRESDGISQLFVKLPAPKKTSFFHFKELFGFGTALSENSPSLGGIFKPDVVISGGVFPASIFAAAKIAECSNARLITELSCLPAELLKRSGKRFFFDPVLIFIKKGIETAFAKSSAVLGFFPKASACFSGRKTLYPMCFPAPDFPGEPSEKAVFLRESLLSFREGGTFVLAFCGELEEGFSIEELILSAANFGAKFALVFLSEGSKKPYFKRFVAEKGITDVFFFDDVPKEELSYILSAADGIFVSESDFAKGFFPEQENFFKAFRAQKPVIAASEHWTDFFRRSGGTVIVKPRRKESISLGIKTLLSMAETDRETLGLALADFVRKNSMQNFAKEYFSLFDNLLSQKENKK